MTHFNAKYEAKLPVWVATELLDFGGLSFLYEGMLRADRDEIALALKVHDAGGAGNGRALANWLRVLNYLRNVCAHHSRLWNRNMTDQIATSRVRPIPQLAHLADPNTQHENARPFAALCTVAYLLGQVTDDSDYAIRVKALVSDRLPETGRRAWEMGFPDGWTDLPLWQ